jgi:hypothetical protein
MRFGSVEELFSQQGEFLHNLQLLLAERLLVASYKFALVHALADLAVLKGATPELR